MSETKKGKYTKDNKKWMQMLINEESGRELTKAIQSKVTDLEDIVWLSPLKEKRYERSHLYQKQILEKLNIKEEDKEALPKTHPLWDAIGTAKDTIILVEADNSRYMVGSCLNYMSKLKSRGYKVKLILLNIIHKNTYLPLIHNDWDLPYKKIFIDVYGRMDTPEDVILLDYRIK